MLFVSDVQAARRSPAAENAIEETGGRSDNDAIEFHSEFQSWMRSPAEVANTSVLGEYTTALMRPDCLRVLTFLRDVTS